MPPARPIGGGLGVFSGRQRRPDGKHHSPGVAQILFCGIFRSFGLLGTAIPARQECLLLRCCPRAEEKTIFGETALSAESKPPPPNGRWGIFPGRQRRPQNKTVRSSGAHGGLSISRVLVLFSDNKYNDYYNKNYRCHAYKNERQHGIAFFLCFGRTAAVCCGGGVFCRRTLLNR